MVAVMKRNSSVAVLPVRVPPKRLPMSGMSTSSGMPVFTWSRISSWSPPITMVWPSLISTCVLVSRDEMIGALNCVSPVAALISCWTTSDTYPSWLMVGRMVSLVPTSRYWTT
jgi:hypothetical protein